MRYLFALLLCLPSFATDTGWVFATNGYSNDYLSGTAWTNPGNVTAQDSTYATCAPTALGFADYIRGAFSLTIPAGATINGIEVRFRAKRSASGPEEVSVRLVIGGTYAGTDGSNYSVLTGTDSDYTRGSSTDLWGLTPTRDQCVATNFGFVVAFEDTDSSVETISVDALSIKVYYTEAGGGSPTYDAASLMALEGE